MIKWPSSRSQNDKTISNEITKKKEIIHVDTRSSIKISNDLKKKYIEKNIQIV